MAAIAPKFITVPAAVKHTATVIFIHGLGDSGYGWKPVAELMRSDPALGHVKWVLPHAPARSITANFGSVMPGWFDIYSFGVIREKEDEEGILESAKSLNKLIEAEVEGGIPPERIVLGGFSQGAAMTLTMGLTMERKLAGLSVLSGYIPIRNKVKEMFQSHATSVPIFCGHGTADPLLEVSLIKASIEYLENEFGFTVRRQTREYKPGISFNVYEGMAHSVEPEELNDWKAWLKQALPA